MKVIRKPKLSEVEGIKRLLDLAAEKGNVLRRPLMELYENMRDFYVYADEQGVGGCCALHIDTPDLAEIRSLVVRPDLRRTGVGRRLLEACLEEARSLDIARVYCLTRAPEFFSNNGFAELDKHELPHKVFNDCVKCPLFPNCDEIAMVRPLEHATAEGRAAQGITGTIGFLGYGNMGAAIAKGLIHAKATTPDRILVYDVSDEKRTEAAAQGFAVKNSPEELTKGSDTLLLAVKPQSMNEALAPVKAALQSKTLIVSIAAGISIAKLQAALGSDVRVARVMPNTPALVQAGAAGVAMSAQCTRADVDTVRAVFEAAGIVEIVPESLMDAVTALSGSGPAYFFYMVECLIEAAHREGLDPDQARRLAGQTLLGAGRLLQDTGEMPSVLRERVTSKGGTTAAALEAFRKGDLAALVASAVSAAATRSRELGA